MLNFNQRANVMNGSSRNAFPLRVAKYHMMDHKSNEGIKEELEMTDINTTVKYHQKK
jgi:hypothetical protein